MLPLVWQMYFVSCSLETLHMGIMHISVKLTVSNIPCLAVLFWFCITYEVFNAIHKYFNLVAIFILNIIQLC